MSNIEAPPIGKVQTLSVLAGTEACNARCPFCISKMTPNNELGIKEPPIVWERFWNALEYAAIGNANTFMITGKGEPTLFPDHVTAFLATALAFEKKTGFRFQKKELQSNGIRIEQKPEFYEPYLAAWKHLGLTTYIVSFVGYDAKLNQEVYIPYERSYIDLRSLVSRLHKYGLGVRLSCIMFAGGIDSAEKFKHLIEFVQSTGADELTARPVNRPERSRNLSVSQWVLGHEISAEQLTEISLYLNSVGMVKNRYAFGATIYEVNGQNVCLTNSLTKDSNPAEQMRQLIFHLNGDIATDWTEDAGYLP